jgi:hypothetical protein
VFVVSGWLLRRIKELQYIVIVVWCLSVMMAGYQQKNDEFKISWYSVCPSDEFDTSKMGNVNSGTSFETLEGVYGEMNPGLSHLDPAVSSEGPYDAHTCPSSAQYYGTQFEIEEEPPLLEELGINPDRIFEKSVAVLNPFHSDVPFNVNILDEADLAGPVALCILLGACLMLAGSKAHFGYVYGVVMISCIAMYILLTLMTTKGNITFASIASVLGYCLLPVVVLSVLGIFLPLYSPLGLVCAALAVMWSSLSASKLFVMMSGDRQQRPLLAYPCALLYGTFALVIVF